MLEGLVPLCFTDGGNSVTLGANYRYFYAPPFGFTIVYATVSSSADDASLTVDINDDGSGVITALDASDADVPGTWKSTDVGGTQTPVKVAGNSKISFDANNAASGSQVHVQLWVKLHTA